MRLISRVRDSYDYLLTSRDQRERVYKRMDSLMLDLSTLDYFKIAKSRYFHQLETRDATLYLTRLMNGDYRYFSHSLFLDRYDRIMVVVVGTRLFVLVRRDKDKSMENITPFLRDKSFSLERLATMLRMESDMGPLVGVCSLNRHEFVPFIPQMSNLLKVIGMTNEEVVQEMENALIMDNPDPAMPDISDKDRIVQHGFDLKTSFRNVK